MVFEFKMPDIGEGVTEGEIVEWHVHLGDFVEEDEPMVEVMTDKATVTIGAPRAGRIESIHFAVGDVARVGQVILCIDTTSGEEAEVAAPAAASSEGSAATAVGDIRDVLPGTGLYSGTTAKAGRSNGNGGGHPSRPSELRSSGGDASGSSARREPTDYFSAKPLATPAARKLARDLGVDLRRVKPTGENERVTMDDIRSFRVAERMGSSSQRILPAQPELVDATQRSDRNDRVRRVPFVGVRRKIAQRMQAATSRAAHFTFVEECHVDHLVELRDRMRLEASKRGTRLNFLPFIIKAVCIALARHPTLNSFLDEEAGELVYRDYYDIGVATATPGGLLVPVLQDADKKSLIELSRDVERLAEGARQGTLRGDELSGSTFTVTSLGRRGGVFATPILNYPEVGILGIHRIREKPVVVNGKVDVGKIMMLSLTFDHRVVDGDVGTAFAYEVIDLLEQPENLFLDLA